LNQPFHAADIKDGAVAAEMAEQTWADIIKAKRLLDWEPRVTPENGFRLTVNWHVTNRKWLGSIIP